MRTPWKDAVFYHLYPLGAFGAPAVNDRVSRPEPRISRISAWIPAMKAIGAEYLYLGPVFESERHGYDTLDYLTVDRRLGTNDDLRRIFTELRANGIFVVLDAVFNHVGRGHPIVRAVVERGSASPYARWISGYRPEGPSRGGLPFGYEGWHGYDDLVKLDTGNPDVREYLIGAALAWMDEFGIAGLRLDAADCMDRGFIRMLADRCRSVDPEFFVMGEAVHGDHYAPLIEGGGLDAVTNYEAWKGLWSSYNDRNYFEIAWTLDRLFGEGGLVRGRAMYSFADNHDVDRVSSILRDQAGLYPLYAMLFSMPGLPSVYYGSEYAVTGKKAPGDDAPLRPALDPVELAARGNLDLARAVARFSEARRRSRALRAGGYRTLAVKNEGMAFLRSHGDENVVAVFNGSESPLSFKISDGHLAQRGFNDLLESRYSARFDSSGTATIDVPPHWVRLLSSGL